MRDALNKSLEILIWIATAIMVLMSCYVGAMIIRGIASVPGTGVLEILGGILFIVFGITMSCVFAGICFQIMDIRRFTKHAAFALRGRPQG
ncbi:hypothetical protein [Pseudodonghicola xiamenensis]|uniref:Uncharacterized protein n=1 Tax=Pseudodonghicola xiamenensis TaxID=337702 RepID=A0A8J3HAR0_9RHOB|nr:hypothetical protein [Pseudodonghicola xiamenensis]GHG98436.1 hypothetical protein GCM10010961_33750 [Pseudodonghicola xiamenensis]